MDEKGLAAAEAMRNAEDALAGARKMQGRAVMSLAIACGALGFALGVLISEIKGWIW